MTREQIQDEASSLTSKNVLYELATGTGKSLAAIKYMQKNSKGTPKVLVVVPRRVLMENWKDEMSKWNFFAEVEFSTYVPISIAKLRGRMYDFIVWDECHHISERVIDELCRHDCVMGERNVLLSATVGFKLFDTLRKSFRGLVKYSYKLSDAIEDSVLPTPKILLIPMTLESMKGGVEYILHKNAGMTVKGSYLDIDKYRYNKSIRFVCTMPYYLAYAELNKKFQFAKKAKRMNQTAIIGGQMLDLCAKAKEDFVARLSFDKRIKREGLLMFCKDIEQANALCAHSVHYKNKYSADNLRSFNSGRIKAMSCVDSLNEGVNLKRCRVGIWCKINTSETMSIQKSGRILRHEKPVYIIPYFEDTREEDAVHKFLELTGAGDRMYAFTQNLLNKFLTQLFDE